MDGEPTPFASRAVRATKDSASLRVTIPQVIATTLGLHPGDDVVWSVDPVDGRVRVTGIRRNVLDGTPETISDETT